MLSRGTSSLLFGAHQLIIHPLILAYCYYKLYGLTLDPRVWISFIVHDWGYFGKPNMDGQEGKMHPVFGAMIMKSLFGKKWYYFTVCHSRYMSDFYKLKVSRLCMADKMAILYTPLWLYTKSELSEYMSYCNETDRGFWKQKLDNRVKEFIKDADNRSVVTRYELYEERIGDL
jgi:hypothetical protein